MSRYQSLPLASARPGMAGKPRVYEEGRICAEPSCDTKLSRYNDKLRCFVHATATPARRTDRAPRR